MAGVVDNPRDQPDRMDVALPVPGATARAKVGRARSEEVAGEARRVKRQEPWPDRYYTGSCNNGHERTPENTYITKKPYGGIKRQCRICRAGNREETR